MTDHGATLARLLAAEIASPWAIEEIDAGQLTCSALDDLERRSHLYALGKGGHAYIVNEAHGLRQDVIRRLLVVLEDIPDHTLWIFTTTRDGQESLFADHEDCGPLLSRCLPVALSAYGVGDAFAKRCQEIAKAEHLDGKPMAAYKRLAADCRNNFRAMLEAVELGKMKD